MRGFARFCGLLMLVAGIGALVAPYFIGRHFEASFRDGVAAIAAKTQLPIRLLEYDRGWFDARARVAIGPGPGVLQFGIDVAHGPLPHLNWVTMDLELRRSPSFMVFNEMPATGSARVGWFGDTRIDVVSPAAERSMSPVGDGIRYVAWGGMHANLHYTPDTKRFALAMDIPRVLVKKATGRLDIRGVSVDMHGPAVFGLPSKRSDWRSTQTIGIERFTFKPSAMRMLTYAGRLHTETSTPTPDTVAYSVALDIDDLERMEPQAEPVSLSKARARIAARGLDRSALEQLAGAIQAATSNPNASQGALHLPSKAYLSRIFENYLPAVLAGEPTFVVELPTFVNDTGDFEGRLEATLKPAEGAARTRLTTAGVVERMSVSGQASIDQTHLRRWLDQRPPSDEANQKFEELVDIGLLKLDNGRVRVRFVFDDDTLAFNNHVAPPKFQRAFRDNFVESFAKAASRYSLVSDSAKPAGVPDAAPSKDSDDRFADDYHRRVYRSLAAHKIYPPAALRDRLQGTAVIQLTVERSGRIVDFSVIESSGHAVLDRAAERMVRDTGSLPPFPSHYEAERIVLKAPVVFQLR